MRVAEGHTSLRGRRIGLFTPYDLVPGGGERYLLAMAATLQRLGRVELLAPERYSSLRVDQLARDLGLTLEEALPVTRVDPGAAPYHLFVAMGNEAVPPMRGLGQRNLFVCQFPFPADPRVVSERRTFTGGYQSTVVYSEFARGALTEARKRLALPPADITILYPPCRVPDVPPAERSHDGVVRIVSVGRFFTGGHAKRHDLLIRAFRELVREAPPAGRGYELHLVGSASARWGSRAYLDTLHESARGLPVTTHVNATIGAVQHLLESSDLYWHAAGLGTSVTRFPERMEHFGISVVEAMGAGCVPVVFRGGGPLEIVEEGRTGYLFGSVRELLAATRQHSSIVREDPGQAMAWRLAAWAAAQRFSDPAFAERLTALVGSLGL
jgi:glycosyltransferase involved in cell wall biosynthesis